MLTVKEKLTLLRPNSQGREVLEVQLIHNHDISSIPDIKLVIGTVAYNLWLPICFIEFEPIPTNILTPIIATMEVIPDRLFDSPQKLAALFPTTEKISENTLAITGRSCFGDVITHTTWADGFIKITAAEQFLLYFGFLLHKFE